MPIFALANAGLTFGPDILATLTTPVAFGIMVGLLAGKPIGIVCAAWISVRTGVATLPEEVSWRHLAGVGFLGGIGFTMSLFITGLAFTEGEVSMSAKAGILLASTVAGSMGWLVLRQTTQPAS
jgi:NhaA family Na+:H+ antiporter